MDVVQKRIKLLLERTLHTVAEKYDNEITTSELLRAENARLRVKLKITLNTLKYVRDAWDTLLESEIVDEILPAIEIGEEE